MTKMTLYYGRFDCVCEVCEVCEVCDRLYLFHKSGCPTGILFPLVSPAQSTIKTHGILEIQIARVLQPNAPKVTIYPRYPPTYELTPVHLRQSARTASENPLIVPIPHPPPMPMPHARIHMGIHAGMATGDGGRGRKGDERGISYPSPAVLHSSYCARFRLYILSPHPVVRPPLQEIQDQYQKQKN